MFFRRLIKVCPATLWVSALCASLLAHGFVNAQVSDEAVMQDLWQTVQARKLFLDDPQLASLNLGVKVINRAAFLWGPVPSQELALRAEQRLRTMFELVEVRNNLTVQMDDAVAPNAPQAPEKLLPQGAPTGAPKMQRRPVLQPNGRGELAGTIIPDQVTSARSSPLAQNPFPQVGPALVRLPFLGSVLLPR